MNKNLSAKVPHVQAYSVLASVGGNPRHKVPSEVRLDKDLHEDDTD